MYPPSHKQQWSWGYLTHVLTLVPKIAKNTTKKAAIFSDNCFSFKWCHQHGKIFTLLLFILSHFTINILRHNKIRQNEYKLLKTFVGQMLDKFVFFWQLSDKCWTPFCNNYSSVNNLYTAPYFSIFYKNNTRILFHYHHLRNHLSYPF